MNTTPGTTSATKDMQHARERRRHERRPHGIHDPEAERQELEAMQRNIRTRERIIGVAIALSLALVLALFTGPLLGLLLQFLQIPK